MDYKSFIESKDFLYEGNGMDPMEVNPMLFDFQKDLVTWALRKGQAAIFADCGLGKTAIQLEWADQVARHTGGKVLIATPLSVGYQTVKEAEKFHIEAHRSTDGTPKPNITITNYEKLHLFNRDDYVGVVCDESSILKNFNGATKKMITEFMQGKRYRLLCTATAAPNDYIELGTSAEALGVMGYMDMLSLFFKNDANNMSSRDRAYGKVLKWRFKRHAETTFWRWVCSWARAIRRPSDIGFPDDGFSLPPLIENEIVIPVSRPLPGMLFPMPATNLPEQRMEQRYTLKERCQRVAALVDKSDPSLIWCHLNDEGDYLEKIIPGSKQVKGSMSDEVKEERMTGFSNGDIRVLITKPKIGAFGMNWQHCNHMTFFPSHSYEQYYQGVRRCWRYGQDRTVTVDIVTSEGEMEILENLKRKSEQADKMFDSLVELMHEGMRVRHALEFATQTEVPSWL